MSSEDDYSDDDFEWRMQKAATNWLDHGVSFAGCVRPTDLEKLESASLSSRAATTSPKFSGSHGEVASSDLDAWPASVTCGSDAECVGKSRERFHSDAVGGAAFDAGNRCASDGGALRKLPLRKAVSRPSDDDVDTDSLRCRRARRGGRSVAHSCESPLMLPNTKLATVPWNYGPVCLINALHAVPGRTT
jgi:hypothetical protein